MDPQRFDRFSKAVAGSLTRREAVAGAGLSGLVAALTPWRGSSSGAALQAGTTCTYDFEVAIGVGPSSRRKSTRSVSGELRLTIGGDGTIDEGVLVEADGTESLVVGQANGRAVNLRIAHGDGEAIVAVGTAEVPVLDCRGTMGGPASGPQRGDLGDWVATVKSGDQGSGSGAGAGVIATAQPSPVDEGQPDSSGQDGSSDCNLTCIGDEITFDEAACACYCPNGQSACVIEVGSIPAKGGVIFKGSVTQPTGFCTDVSSDLSNCGDCGRACEFNERIANAVCIGGGCRYDCAPGYDKCGNRDLSDACTTDLSSDKFNCGACGNACPGDFSCDGGNCRCLLACFSPQVLDEANCSCICPGGLTACGTECVDTSSDVNNCGSCGNDCGPVASECSAGKCIPLASQ